jgi:hypothetical protein
VDIIVRMSMFMKRTVNSDDDDIDDDDATNG